MRPGETCTTKNAYYISILSAKKKATIHRTFMKNQGEQQKSSPDIGGARDTAVPILS